MCNFDSEEFRIESQFDILDLPLLTKPLTNGKLAWAG